MDDTFLHKYTQKLAENSEISTNSHCRMWLQTPSKKYGVISCKISSGWKSFYVHRLAYMIHIRSFDIPAGMDVSHLCHNNKCITVHHLSVEPHYINNNRQNCVSEKSCSGHGVYPNCMFHLII